MSRFLVCSLLAGLCLSACSSSPPPAQPQSSQSPEPLMAPSDTVRGKAADIHQKAMDRERINPETQTQQPSPESSP